MAIIFKKSFLNFIIVLGTIVFFSGCTSASFNSSYTKQESENKDFFTQLNKEFKPKNQLQSHIKDGLNEFKNANYIQASKEFQKALRLNPANGNLHFLNALSYHMNAKSGNIKYFNLAKSGYITTLKFDDSNYLAAYFLGQIYLKQKQYIDAQNMFAYGLLYAPKNEKLLQAMSVASYYTHDLDINRWATYNAYSQNTNDPINIKNLIYSQAAQGNIKKANSLLKEFKRRQNHTQVNRIDKRLNDWNIYYASNSIFNTPSSDIVTYGGAEDDSNTTNTANQQNSLPIKNDLLKNDKKDIKTKNTSDENLPKMALIDVVIVRTKEVRSQSKGINLLDGLKTTLSGTLIGYTKTQGKDASDGIIMASEFNLMDLEYNFNIFNDSVNKAEVLARPSLLSTENSTSTFFSGGALHVQLSSNNSDGSMIDIPIGITLSVTPQFLNKETLKVHVNAKRSFLEMQSAVVGFTSFSQTSKTTVNTTAVMKFDETLILSGLTETTTESSNSGVPFLKEVPIVQYLFSTDEELETKKSILIFLTPRKPQYSEDLTDDELDAGKDIQKVYISKLKKKEKIVNSNLNSIKSHMLEESGYYRQFRTGDMGVRFWEDEDSIYSAIKRALGFLYF